MTELEQLEQLLNILGVTIKDHLIKIEELYSKLQCLSFDFVAITEAIVNKNKLLCKFFRGEAVSIKVKHNKIDIAISENQLVKVFRSVLKLNCLDIADIMWSNSQLRELFTKTEIMDNFNLALSGCYAPAIEALWKDGELKKQFAGNGVSLIELRYRFASVLASGNRVVINEMWYASAALRQDLRKFPPVNVSREIEAIFKQLLTMEVTSIGSNVEDQKVETAGEDSLSSSASGSSVMDAVSPKQERVSLFTYPVRMKGNGKNISKMRREIKRSAESYLLSKGTLDDRQMCSRCGFFMPEEEDGPTPQAKEDTEKDTKKDTLVKNASGYNLLLNIFPPTTPCH